MEPLICMGGLGQAAEVLISAGFLERLPAPLRFAASEMKHAGEPYRVSTAGR